MAAYLYLSLQEMVMPLLCHLLVPSLLNPIVISTHFTRQSRKHTAPIYTESCEPSSARAATKEAWLTSDKALIVAASARRGQVAQVCLLTTRGPKKTKCK